MKDKLNDFSIPHALITSLILRYKSVELWSCSLPCTGFSVEFHQSLLKEGCMAKSPPGPGELTKGGWGRRGKGGRSASRRLSPRTVFNCIPTPVIGTALGRPAGHRYEWILPVSLTPPTTSSFVFPARHNSCLTTSFCLHYSM